MNKNTNYNINRLIFGALFMALICLATMVIRIPSPTGGYVNAGDCFVLLSGWIFGPHFGFLIAGLGSALADGLAGYMHYVPATFIIKGLTAAIAGITLKAFTNNRFRYILGGILGELEMVIGYFFFTSLLLGKGIASLASVPGDLAQGLFGIVIACNLIAVVSKTNLKELVKADYKRPDIQK